MLWSVYTGELDRRIRRPMKRPATTKLANTATAKGDREEGDDNDDDDDDHDHDDATKIKNESMLGELRVYVKVVDQKRHFVGPRGG